jgi:hypothetical protein
MRAGKPIRVAFRCDWRTAFIAVGGKLYREWLVRGRRVIMLRERPLSFKERNSLVIYAHRAYPHASRPRLGRDIPYTNFKPLGKPFIGLSTNGKVDSVPPTVLERNRPTYVQKAPIESTAIGAFTFPLHSCGLFNL